MAGYPIDACVIDVYENVTYDITARPAVVARGGGTGAVPAGGQPAVRLVGPGDLPEPTEAFDLVLHAAGCPRPACVRCSPRLPARRGPVGFGDPTQTLAGGVPGDEVVMVWPLDHTRHALRRAWPRS